MSEYKEELERIFEREDRFRRKVIKPLFCSAAIVIGVGLVSLFCSHSALADNPSLDDYLLNEVSQGDIDQAKEDRDNAQAQAEEAAARVDALSSQRNQLSGQLAELNEANEEQRAQYELIATQLEAALEAKAQALDEFIAAQETLEAQQALFEQRVSIMFEYQNKSTLDVLLESNSIAGFFTNMEIITLIADSDSQAIDRMQVALDDAELQKEVKLQEANDMQAVADEKQAQLDELAAMIGTTQDTLSDVSTQLSSWEAQEDELEDYANSLDDTVRQLQSQYAAEHATATPVPRETSSNNNSSTSPAPTTAPSPSTSDAPSISVSISWPTNSRVVSSYFGNRYHPVYGTYKFHSGIDISADYGATIMSAASGTVIYVTEPVEGQNTGGTGYGNYCIIDHGDGVTTLYGHARDIYVSTGDTVSAGQAIGEVGSTGTSTGAHLHFEVRVNGTRYDPLAYLS